jgi:hypothetical protein
VNVAIVGVGMHPFGRFEGMCTGLPADCFPLDDDGA